MFAAVASELLPEIMEKMCRKIKINLTLDQIDAQFIHVLNETFGSHPGGTVGLGEQQAEMAPYGVFTTVSRDAFGIP